MNGRVNQSTDLLTETKNPIILYPNHQVTQLLVEFYHRKAAHIGQETILNNLRKRFWILKARRLIKKVKMNCYHCRIINTKPEVPLMGDLPDLQWKNERDFP